MSIHQAVRSSFLGSVLAAGLLASTGSLPAWAQSQSINGTIRGHVADASGASVGEASVTVTNSEVGFSKTVSTGDDGYFVLLNLPLGTYKMVVDKSGFNPFTYEQVQLNAGKEMTLDAVLQVGRTSTQVEVMAGASTIDPSTLNVQRTLESREVENLPLTSRNPYNFILFQPGISGHPNPNLGIPRTVNTNGLLDRINYQMDGMVNTQSDRYGLRLFPIGNIFVKEVQTVSNSFAPEYGWMDGDVYNVITNSGTNSFHGLFQWLKRLQDATAFPLLSKPGSEKPDQELTDYSANAGGRVIKDKLFFFGAYEHLTFGQPIPVTITSGNAAALGIPASDLVTSPSLQYAQFADARLDWNINAKNQMFVRYNYFRNRTPFNAAQAGGLNARSANFDYKDRAHVVGLQLISTLNDHTLNEFRFSVPLRSNVYFPGPETGPGPAIIIPGVAIFNGTTSAGAQFTEKTPNGSDNLSYVHGSHTLKAGFVLAQIEDKQRLVSFNSYTFPSVAAYLSAKSGATPFSYTQYASQQDANGVGYASLFWGAYAQDTWQVSRKLVAVYGLRYDRFHSPNPDPSAPFVNSQKFNVPATNFAPRAGFSYSLNDKTVVKASAGLFYEQVPTNLWFNALNLDGSNRTSSVTYSGTQSGAPAFPAVPSSVSTTAPQNVTTVSPAFKNEYAWNVNAQISRELTAHDSLMVAYIMANGRNLMYQHNINLINPIGHLADGRPVFDTAVNASTRANPKFNQINQVESGANSSFNALALNYTRYLTRGIQLNANYTWSHTISDAPEVNTFEQSLPIEDTTNPKRDRGNSYVNHPNAFNLSAVMEPKFDLSNSLLKTLANSNMLAVLANLSSGDQASIIANPGTINGDSSTGSVGRPAFVGRNTVRSPNIYQVDARYTRTFPKLYDRISVSFLAEANNIFNHPNITTISTTQAVTPFSRTTPGPNGGVATTNNPTVTRTTILEARIVQMGLAVRW